MGRKAKGLRVVWRNGVGYARFTWEKKRWFVSTGETDPRRVEEQANEIYTEVRAGRRRRVTASLLSKEPLDVMFAEWLASLEGILDDETVKTYKNTYVATHFVPFFRSLTRAVDAAIIDQYARERLRKVLRKTLHKELGALKGFLKWCKTQGLIPALPEWPDLPRTAKGKRSGPQREKANELSEADVANAIRGLPILSHRVSKSDRRPFAVRARFIFAYETGLRPATIDALQTPRHWVPGSSSLLIEEEHDKARFGRTLTLTGPAQAALEHTVRLLCISEGLVFGRHDYRVYLENAGLEGLAAYDFRHARGTHLVNRGASLSGVAYQFGHTQLTTTAKYTHPNRAAGDAALLVGGALSSTDSGAIADQKEKP